MYQECINGLASSDPSTVLDSALWIVENPGELIDQNAYSQSCEILFNACMSDTECIAYIHGNLVHDLVFKTQLFAQVLSQSSEQDIREAIIKSLEPLIEEVSQVKSVDTDMVAEIYSYLQESGEPKIIEKSKSLLQ